MEEILKRWKLFKQVKKKKTTKNRYKKETKEKERDKMIAIKEGEEKEI